MDPNAHGVRDNLESMRPGHAATRREILRDLLRFHPHLRHPARRHAHLLGQNTGNRATPPANFP
jgi:hypothetical protein